MGYELHAEFSNAALSAVPDVLVLCFVMEQNSGPDGKGRRDTALPRRRLLEMYWDNGKWKLLCYNRVDIGDTIPLHITSVEWGPPGGL